MLQLAPLSHTESYSSACMRSSTIHVSNHLWVCVSFVHDQNKQFCFILYTTRNISPKFQMKNDEPDAHCFTFSYTSLEKKRSFPVCGFCFQWLSQRSTVVSESTVLLSYTSDQCKDKPFRKGTS